MSSALGTSFTSSARASLIHQRLVSSRPTPLASLGGFVTGDERASGGHAPVILSCVATSSDSCTMADTWTGDLGCRGLVYLLCAFTSSARAPPCAVECRGERPPPTFGSCYGPSSVLPLLVLSQYVGVVWITGKLEFHPPTRVYIPDGHAATPYTLALRACMVMAKDHTAPTRTWNHDTAALTW